MFTYSASTDSITQPGPSLIQLSILYKDSWNELSSWYFINKVASHKYLIHHKKEVLGVNLFFKPFTFSFLIKCYKMGVFETFLCFFFIQKTHFCNIQQCLT